MKNEERMKSNLELFYFFLSRYARLYIYIYIHVIVFDIWDVISEIKFASLYHSSPGGERKREREGRNV